MKVYMQEKIEVVHVGNLTYYVTCDRYHNGSWSVACWVGRGKYPYQYRVWEGDTYTFDVYHNAINRAVRRSCWEAAIVAYDVQGE